MPAGFWDYFFDNDYRQRADISDLRDQLAIATDTSHIANATATLHRQIGDLSVLVSTLVRMLEESGHVDSKVLRYRVEAELETMRAAYGPGPASMGEALRAGGSSESPQEAPPPTTPTQCTKCGQTVPANRTTITANGVVCDRCAG